MKIPTTIILLWLSVYLLSAQTTPPPAPDFTVTTSDGVQRKLYEDYLNQGKTVVLYLFFTTCPNCNAIAPLLEPFYQEWGGGSGPVEFLMLSILSTDSNFDVGRYLGLKDLTFPGAGSDGGAGDALKPYTDGTYGLYVGTPTFIVIGQDGAVRYNPRGSSYEETIDSVDQAIRLTGVQKPASNFQVSGDIKNPLGVPLANVNIEIKYSETVPAITDTSGQFNFPVPLVARDQYGIRFSKDGSPKNGVSTFDIVRVQRHLLGIEPFDSPYQMLAADVDRSGSVNIADVVYMRKLVLSIEPELPNGRSWLFINADFTFTEATNPFYDAYLGEAATFAITASGIIPPVSAIAIKLGDLDFNAR